MNHNTKETHVVDSHGKVQGLVEKTISRVSIGLSMPVEQSMANLTVLEGGDKNFGLASRLRTAGQFAEIFFQFVDSPTANEILDFVREGYPVVIVQDASAVVIEDVQGIQANASLIGETIESKTLTRRRVAGLLQDHSNVKVLVAKRELECDSLSSMRDADARTHDSEGSHGASPVHRFLTLLKFDHRDITTLILFALVGGVLSLATPLAIESLVNVVSWGRYLQPLVILAIMLMTCLGLSGVLNILQTLVVEIIQRRQFVRIVGDLAHRFPRANQSYVRSHHPREYANRVFDVMTIQKATAILMLDGISIILTTILGLILLAFYHPFLLGFDIVLVLSMISVTWMLGFGGIRTAIEESITKYKVVYWLQDMLASPAAFKVNGGEAFGVNRANQLTANYVHTRQAQFRVVLRQVSFAIALQVIASTALLGLGGWLVIAGELTLGQLVASELVVTVVVGAFAKAGKSLEKFFDLMAGMDKVGHLLDIPVDTRVDVGELPEDALAVRWDGLILSTPTTFSQIDGMNLLPNSSAAIVGDDYHGCSLLAQSIAGLYQPDSGVVRIGETDALDVVASGADRWVAYAGNPEIFHGTIRSNVDLGRPGIAPSEVRETLQKVGLTDAVMRLPEGTQEVLQSHGYPLNEIQVLQLMIARAISGKPRLLVIDGLLDRLPPSLRNQIIDVLLADENRWTLIVVTHDPHLASRFDSQISMRGE